MARYRVGMGANAALGVDTPSSGAASSSARRGGPGGSFHPTVVSLLLLISAQYAAFIFLRRYFRHAHGG